MDLCIERCFNILENSVGCRPSEFLTNGNLEDFENEAPPPVFPDSGRYAVLVLPQPVSRGKYDANLSPITQS